MTTYEMRISDWSSDVCSSDLPGYFPLELNLCPDAFQIAVNDRDRQLLTGPPVGDGAVPRRERSIDLGFIPSLGMSNIAKAEIIRSEEHTSELQSLMRISYAVFCLKKKTHKLTIILST